MKQLFLPGTKELFVLFHGTGGNEEILLPIVGDWNAHASVLSFLGNVGSGQQRRFFAPLLAGGRVDREDLARRVHEFAREWERLKEHYTDYQITFVGYSNGANFILALLEKYPEIAKRVVLLHPSNLGFHFNQAPSSKIWMTAGASDPIAPAGGVVTLNLALQKMGVDSQVLLFDGEHAVTQKEIDTLKSKLEETI